MGLFAAESVQYLLECRTAVAVSECLDGDHGDYVGGDFRQDVGDEGQPDEDTTGDERGNFGAAVDAGLWLGNAALDCERGTGAGAGGADGNSADDSAEDSAAGRRRLVGGDLPGAYTWLVVVDKTFCT